MNLLADENIDRQDGHDVLYVAEFEPSISDAVVFDRANEKSALLITADKDFGEIVFRDNRLSSGGVVLLRLAGLSAEKKAALVSEIFQTRGAEFPNHFSVVAPGKIRIREK